VRYSSPLVSSTGITFGCRGSVTPFASVVKKL